MRLIAVSCCVVCVLSSLSSPTNATPCSDQDTCDIPKLSFLQTETELREALVSDHTAKARSFSGQVQDFLRPSPSDLKELEGGPTQGKSKAQENVEMPKKAIQQKNHSQFEDTVEAIRDGAAPSTVRLKVLGVPIAAAIIVAVMAKIFPDSTGAKAALATSFFWGLEDYLLDLGGAHLVGLEAVRFIAWFFAFHVLTLMVQSALCCKFNAQYPEDVMQILRNGLSAYLVALSVVAASALMLCFVFPYGVFLIDPVGGGPASALVATAPVLTSAYLWLKGQRPSISQIAFTVLFLAGVAAMKAGGEESIPYSVIILFLFTAAAITIETGSCELLAEGGMPIDVAVSVRFIILSTFGLLMLFVYACLWGNPAMNTYWMIVAGCLSFTGSSATYFCQVASSAPNCSLLVNTLIMSSCCLTLTILNLLLLGYRPFWNEWCGMILVVIGVVGSSMYGTEDDGDIGAKKEGNA